MTTAPDLPRSLASFARRFGDERACAEHLAQLRWPTGFRCGSCGGNRSWHLEVRPRVFECAACGIQISVTSGTVMHRSKVSLVEWFWAAWCVGQDKRGVSALQLSKMLGRRYETVWRLLHKLRVALAEDDAVFPLHGVVEVDEAYVGGKTTTDRGGRSLKDPRRSLVVAAVERQECRPGNPGVRGTGTRCGAARFSVVDHADAESLVGFVGRVCAKETTVVSDGWRAYDQLGNRDFDHIRIVLGKPEHASEALPLIHTLFSNFEAWLCGTFHGVSKRWLPRYAQEFVYRLNRRHNEPKLWHYILRRAITRTWFPYSSVPAAAPALAA